MCNSHFQFKTFVLFHSLISEVQIGESRLFNALLASFVGIQISVTATPSRLAHMVQPLLFNVIHVVFTAIYQMLGYTNPAGKNYVYLEMDWVNSR